MTASRPRGMFAWARTLFAPSSGRPESRRRRATARRSPSLSWDGLENRRVLSSTAVALPAGIHDAPLIQMLDQGTPNRAPQMSVDAISEETLDDALIAALEIEATRPGALETIAAGFVAAHEDASMMAIAELVAAGAVAIAVARVSENALKGCAEARLVPVAA